MVPRSEKRCSVATQHSDASTVVTVVRVSYISTQVGFLRPDVFTDSWLHGGVDRRLNDAFFSQRNLTFTLHDVWG